MNDKKKIAPQYLDGSRSEKDSEFSIIQLTKLFKPRLRKEFVKRNSLLKCLDQSLSLPLTLISAPTGCGKSITTSQWLEENNIKYLWLSVDEEHNDISIFLQYLLTLFESKWPDVMFETKSLQGGIDFSAKLIASSLINDIFNLQEHFVLVLDDYHLIQEEKIHEVIGQIMLHPPENFHLMILTQRDPPLRLSRMRAQMRLNELRMRDLAFTVEEANQLRSFIAPETSYDEVETLVNHSEGWIAGISVGFMGLARGVAFERVIQALHSGSSMISELLDEVIISGLPKMNQKFLALTSMLDRFSAELIFDIVASLDDWDLSESHIRELFKLSKERNLFLIPLDQEVGGWYRYHHLFKSQVMNRAGDQFKQEVIQRIYQEASSWFHKRKFYEEALKYAILSEEMDFAVQQFDSMRLTLHNTEQFQRLERLIEMFPSHVIRDRIELLLSLAILQDHKADYKAMQTYLDDAEKILNKRNLEEQAFKQLQGQFHCVSAYLPFMNGDFETAIYHAEKGLNLLPSAEPNYFREYALAYYAMGQQAIGSVKKGLNRIANTLEDPAIKDAYFLGRLFHIQTLVHLISGDAKGVRRPGMQLQALHNPENYPGAWMAGIYAVSTSAYLADKLEDVHQFHDILFRNRFRGRPFGVIHHFMVECLALAAQEEWDKMDSCLTICTKLVSDLDIAPLKGMVHAFEVDLALKRNDIDRATELSNLANFSPHPPLWYYYIPQLTEVKLLLATEQKEKGFHLLEKLIRNGKTCHNENLLIQALTLKAVSLHNKGDHRPALESLMEALKIAKGKQHLRTFLDHGHVMIELIKEVSEEQPGICDVAEIESVLSKTNSSQRIRMDIPLTSRESEILRLVNQGLKNHEIAEKLYVSVDTIKKHLYNCYQKLYVNNRTNAINKARELGLLDAQ